MNFSINKYNRFLISIFVFAPFVAWLTENYLEMSFGRIMQLLSYVGVFLLIVFRNDKNPIIFPKYLLFYLLFIIYVFYTDLYRLHREFKLMYLFSNPFIGGFNFIFIIENLKISKKYYSWLIKMSKFILIISVIVILIQQVYDSSFLTNIKSDTIPGEIIEVDKTQNRLSSIYSWISDIAVGFGFVPIFILLVEELDKRRKYILLWVFLGIIFTFLTKERWIMLNALLVIPILLMNNKNKIKSFFKYLILTPLISFALFFALEYSGVDVVGIVNDRILESDKKGLEAKTAGSRILAFKAFNKFFWDQPIVGKGDIKYGMGATKGKTDYKLTRYLAGRSSQMHVGYLSLLYLYGVIGAFFFLGFLFLLMKKLYKNAKITSIWAPFLAFLGFAIANLTLVTFSVFEMGLIIVLVADKFHTQSIREERKIYA